MDEGMPITHQTLYGLLFGLNNKQVPCRFDSTEARSLYRFMAPLRRGHLFS